MPQPIKKRVEPSTLGLTIDDVKEYSFLRAIRAMANPHDAQAQKDAGFEFEVSRAAAEHWHKPVRGILVPGEILKRDMNVGVGSQGGYMVGAELIFGSFVESLENAMVTAQLGATVLRDLKGDVEIPKQTGGGTAYWVGEGTDVTESTPAIGQVRMSPKTVGAFTDLTRKFILQSSIDGEMFVRKELSRRLALAVDAKALNGEGTPVEPQGIIYTDGVGSVELDATNTPTFEDVVDLESAVAVDNALVGKLGYAGGATIAGKMKQTVRVASTDSEMILEKGMVNGHPFMLSNGVPNKYLLFGNWAELLIGYWSGVDINVDTASLSKSGGVRIVAMMDVDCAVRHAESFAVGYKV